MPRARSILVLAALAVVPLTGSAQAAPQDPAVECAKQYLIVAGPAPERPVTVTSDGKVVVNPGPTVDHTVDWTARTVRFATCVARG